MHRTKISVPESRRKELAALLGDRLADSIDLRLQAKQAHWNVRGPHFFPLHELFDKVAEAVDEFTDMIAERLTTLGGVAEGLVGQAAKRTSLPAYPAKAESGAEHIEAVSTALAAFGKNVRESIEQAEKLDDAATADLFTEVARGVDQQLWFVEAHQQSDR